MKKLFLTIATLTTQATFAATVATTDIWEGSGALFDLNGKANGTYVLVVENAKNDDKIQSNVTVTLPDVSVRKEQCLMTKTNNENWKFECNNGKGGGHCFGEGLCISYIETTEGKAYATTIVMDSSSEMRLLRTELKDGKAVRFFREKLHKR